MVVHSRRMSARFPVLCDRYRVIFEQLRYPFEDHGMVDESPHARDAPQALMRQLFLVKRPHISLQSDRSRHDGHRQSPQRRHVVPVQKGPNLPLDLSVTVLVEILVELAVDLDHIPQFLIRN
jgi:hypothetical protein